jgi:nitroreductase
MTMTLPLLCRRRLFIAASSSTALLAVMIFSTTVAVVVSAFGLNSPSSPHSQTVNNILLRSSDDDRRRYRHRFRRRRHLPSLFSSSPDMLTADSLLTVPSSTQSHALEVFHQFTTMTPRATSGDEENENENDDVGMTISKSSDLYKILNSLDVEATEEEAGVLFRYLDGDGDGRLDFEDFLPWYMDAAEAAFSVAESFQSLLVGRRTIESFDQTPVSKDVLYRAVQCAIAAPNRSCSEPWRFIDVGPQTVQAFANLKEKLTVSQTKETTDSDSDDIPLSSSSSSSPTVDWTQVPGWCVVTTKVSPDVEVEQEDFKSVCCAIQNFMLSMWSEGVGTKWTAGRVQHTQEFADLCSVDTTKERVVGCIWYGYAAGGTKYADPRRRKKTVQDVLSQLP